MPRSFVATAEQRQQVKALAGYGLKQEQIACLLGLASTTTLRKHFRQELTRGPIEAKAQVRSTLFKLATSGRNPGATMYWLKTRAGWSEKGQPPEPVDAHAGEHRWRITVYQPPRTPEQEQQLQEALSHLHESTEWEEWEEYTQPGHVSDRSPRSG